MNKYSYSPANMKVFAGRKEVTLMLKELIEIFSECEHMKEITSCSSAIECNTVALMPVGGKVLKKYTDGKALNFIAVKLLYKLPFSPQGDRDFAADSFFGAVGKWLEDRFGKESVINGNYEFAFLNVSPAYDVEKKTPSVAIYSLELTVYYLKL